MANKFYISSGLPPTEGTPTINRFYIASGLIPTDIVTGGYSHFINGVTPVQVNGVTPVQINGV